MALCHGLIIDVRSNGGGNLTNVERLSSRFFNERTLVGYIAHKKGPGHNDFSPLHPKYCLLYTSGIEQKSGSATRAASATVLGVLAQKVENMVVASADLSNSDKTDGFLKQTKAFAKGDFTGAFLQAGVSEFTMSCLCLLYTSL